MARNGRNTSADAFLRAISRVCSVEDEEIAIREAVRVWQEFQNVRADLLRPSILAPSADDRNVVRRWPGVSPDPFHFCLDAFKSADRPIARP